MIGKESTTSILFEGLIITKIGVIEWIEIKFRILDVAIAIKVD
jgi:hypothetical protein